MLLWQTVPTRILHGKQQAIRTQKAKNDLSQVLLFSLQWHYSKEGITAPVDIYNLVYAA